MAKNGSKSIEWDEVVNTISSESGLPKKQISDTTNAVHEGMKKILQDNQPKRDGDTLNVEHPDYMLIASRVPEKVITDASGNKMVRPSCIAINVATSQDFINAANIGLVDDASIDKNRKPSKKEA